MTLFHFLISVITVIMAFRLSVQYDNYCKEIIWKSSEGNSSFILAHTIAPASIRRSHYFYSSDLVNTAYHINQYILVSANQLFITVRNLLLLLIYHLLWRIVFVIVILQGGEGQGGEKLTESYKEVYWIYSEQVRRNPLRSRFMGEEWRKYKPYHKLLISAPVP